MHVSECVSQGVPKREVKKDCNMELNSIHAVACTGHELASQRRASYK